MKWKTRVRVKITMCILLALAAKKNAWWLVEATSDAGRDAGGEEFGSAGGGRTSYVVRARNTTAASLSPGDRFVLLLCTLSFFGQAGAGASLMDCGWASASAGCRVSGRMVFFFFAGRRQEGGGRKRKRGARGPARGPQTKKSGRVALLRVAVSWSPPVRPPVPRCSPSGLGPRGGGVRDLSVRL